MNSILLRSAVVLMAAWTLSAFAADAPARRAAELATQLRCVVCQNQSIAESNAELAVDLRRVIDEQVKAGRTDREIVAFMVDRYGEFILYRPPLNAGTVVLWLGPAVMLGIGALVLAVYWRRERASAEAMPLNAAEVAQARALLRSGDR